MPTDDRLIMDESEFKQTFIASYLAGIAVREEESMRFYGTNDRLADPEWHGAEDAECIAGAAWEQVVAILNPRKKGKTDGN